MAKSVVACLAFVLTIMVPYVAIAQPQPDPSHWTNGPPNPSGEVAVPLVIYDQVSGILSVDTLGVNRGDDTPDYTTEAGPIGGDDVALESIQLETRGVDLGPDSRILEPFTNLEFQNRLWVGSFVGNFVQIDSFGFRGNLFLWPGQYGIAQLPIGLTEDNFETVEIRTKPELNAASWHQALARGVTVVPEPNSSSIFVILLGVGLKFPIVRGRGFRV